MLVDDLKRLDNVFRMKENSPALRHVVLCTEPDVPPEQLADIEQRSAALGVTVHIWGKLLANGRAQAEQQQPEDHPPSAQDTYIVWSV